jgi:hypothetical protein
MRLTYAIAQEKSSRSAGDRRDRAADKALRASPLSIRFLADVLTVCHGHMSVSPLDSIAGTPLVLDHVGVHTRQCNQVRESCKSRAPPEQLWAD